MDPALIADWRYDLRLCRTAHGAFAIRFSHLPHMYILFESTIYTYSNSGCIFLEFDRSCFPVLCAFAWDQLWKLSEMQPDASLGQSAIARDDNLDSVKTVQHSLVVQILLCSVKKIPTSGRCTSVDIFIASTGGGTISYLGRYPTSPYVPIPACLTMIQSLSHPEYDILGEQSFDG